MKAWKKTPPELVAAFDRALPLSPGVTRRPMFGYASAFVNGSMFAGTFQDAIVVRLAEDDRVELLKLKGAAPFRTDGSPDEGVRRRSSFDRRHAEGAWCVDRAGTPVRAHATGESHSERALGDEGRRETYDRKAGDRQEEIKREVGSYRLSQQMVYTALRGNDDATRILVKPWREAGVTRSDWRRAHRAVVALIAGLVWRTRGSKEARQLERDTAMQRLSRIAEGDPESTRYGLDLAHAEDEHADR